MSLKKKTYILQLRLSIYIYTIGREQDAHVAVFRSFFFFFFIPIHLRFFVHFVFFSIFPSLSRTHIHTRSVSSFPIFHCLLFFHSFFFFSLMFCFVSRHFICIMQVFAPRVSTSCLIYLVKYL